MAAQTTSEYHAAATPPGQTMQFAAFAAFAIRPLRLLELAEAVRHNSSSNTSLKRLNEVKDAVRALVGDGLSMLADETILVTASDKTDDDLQLQQVEAHKQLALSCLRYLNEVCLYGMKVGLGQLRDPPPVGIRTFYPPRDANDIIELRLEYPFLKYASSNWFIHVSKSATATGQIQEEINAHVAKLLDMRDSMRIWLHVDWLDKLENVNGFPKLHCVAMMGLDEYTKILLKTEATEVDERDSRMRTALWWASFVGHGSVVALLLQAGADADAAGDAKGLRPLHVAAKRNNAQVIKVLLEAGVDPLTPAMGRNVLPSPDNHSNTWGHTPLMYACQNQNISDGNADAVIAFLPFLKSPDHVHQALGWAAECGNAEAVSHILQHPSAAVNALVSGDSALFRACAFSDLNTIRILVDAGADASRLYADYPDGLGEWYTPYPWTEPIMDLPKLNCLHRLCGIGRFRGGSQKATSDELRIIGRLLIQAGAQVYQNTILGESVLDAAARHPEHSVILTQALIDGAKEFGQIDPSSSSNRSSVAETDADADVAVVAKKDDGIKESDDYDDSPTLLEISNSGGVEETEAETMMIKEDNETNTGLLLRSSSINTLGLTQEQHPPALDAPDTNPSLPPSGEDDKNKDVEEATTDTVIDENHNSKDMENTTDTVIYAGQDVEKKPGAMVEKDPQSKDIEKTTTDAAIDESLKTKDTEIPTEVVTDAGQDIEKTTTDAVIDESPNDDDDNHHADICNDNGQNALHRMLSKVSAYSSQNPDLQDFSRLLAANPSLIGQVDTAGDSPLRIAIIRAARDERAGYAELMLDYEADWTAVDSKGNTLAHILAENLATTQLCSLFRKLISKGIPINARNTNGETPLFVHCGPTRLKIPVPAEVLRIISEARGEALTDQPDPLAMLAELDADFSTRDNRGRGLLHIAALTGRPSKFRILLDRGLDLHLEDETYHTPIDVASASGNLQVLDLIESYKSI